MFLQVVDLAVYPIPTTRVLYWKKPGWRLTGNCYSWNYDHKLKLLFLNLSNSDLQSSKIAICYPKEHFSEVCSITVPLHYMNGFRKCTSRSEKIVILTSHVTGHLSKGQPLWVDSQWEQRPFIDPIQPSPSPNRLVQTGKFRTADPNSREIWLLMACSTPELLWPLQKESLLYTSCVTCHFMKLLCPQKWCPSFCRAEHLQLYLKGAAIWQKRNAPVVTYKGIINICNNHFLIKEKRHVSWFLTTRLVH